MRVGEKSRTLPALSPKRMRLTEDASRTAGTPFGATGQALKPSKVTSLNLGIGKQKRSKRND